MQGSSVQRLDDRSADYWVGYLSAAAQGASESLDKGMKPGEVAKTLRRAHREFVSSQAARPGVEIVAYGVEDDTGECYAIRDTLVAAIKAQGRAVDHLFQAESCGHPRAAGWVAERLPIAVVGMTEMEVMETLAEGTPVLDREP